VGIHGGVERGRSLLKSIDSSFELHDGILAVDGGRITRGHPHENLLIQISLKESSCDITFPDFEVFSGAH
jgi:hypothetical protein